MEVQSNNQYVPIMSDTAAEISKLNLLRNQQSPSEDEITYFVLPRFKMSHRNMIKCTTVALLIAIFLERYCFIVTIYKMKYYGYVLIMIVIALNCAFNLLMTRLTLKRQTKALHDLFSIDRTPKVGSCIIGIIG